MYSNTHRDGSEAMLTDRIIEETDRQKDRQEQERKFTGPQVYLKEL